MSQKLDWRPHGGVAAVINKKGRRLMLIAGQSDHEGWNLLAVEGPGGNPTAEEVFDNHAHDAVANDVPLETALRLAETYAEAWLAGDAEALEKCKCPTIRAPEMGPDGEPELEAVRPVDLDRPCRGCLGLDAEHDFGPTCTLEEKLTPFHLHLEKCSQCREHPFALCTKGLTLLQAEA
jgi:hypothetical protein